MPQRSASPKDKKAVAKRPNNRSRFDPTVIPNIVRQACQRLKQSVRHDSAGDHIRKLLISQELAAELNLRLWASLVVEKRVNPESEETVHCIHPGRLVALGAGALATEPPVACPSCPTPQLGEWTPGTYATTPETPQHTRIWAALASLVLAENMLQREKSLALGLHEGRAIVADDRAPDVNLLSILGRQRWVAPRGWKVGDGNRLADFGVLCLAYRELVGSIRQIDIQAIQTATQAFIQESPDTSAKRTNLDLVFSPRGVLASVLYDVVTRHEDFEWLNYTIQTIVDLLGLGPTDDPPGKRRVDVFNVATDRYAENYSADQHMSAARSDAAILAYQLYSDLLGLHDRYTGARRDRLTRALTTEFASVSLPTSGVPEVIDAGLQTIRRQLTRFAAQCNDDEAREWLSAAAIPMTLSACERLQALPLPSSSVVTLPVGDFRIVCGPSAVDAHLVKVAAGPAHTRYHESYPLPAHWFGSHDTPELVLRVHADGWYASLTRGVRPASLEVWLRTGQPAGDAIVLSQQPARLPLHNPRDVERLKIVLT